MYKQVKNDGGNLNGNDEGNLKLQVNLLLSSYT